MIIEKRVIYPSSLAFLVPILVAKSVATKWNLSSSRQFVVSPFAVSSLYSFHFSRISLKSPLRACEEEARNDLSQSSELFSKYNFLDQCSLQRKFNER